MRTRSLSLLLDTERWCWGPAVERCETPRMPRTRSRLSFSCWRGVQRRSRRGNKLEVGFTASPFARPGRRAFASKRRAREHAMPIHDAEARAAPDLELAEVLEYELARLPDHYRAPILLCDLEGLTRAAAAVRPGCPEGTVAGHLARGRALVARRLLRRGVAPSLTSAAVLWTDNTCAVPPELAEAAARAGAAMPSGLPLTGLVSAQASALAIAVDGGLRFVRWKLAVTVLAVATTVGLGAVVGTPGEQPVAPPKSAPKSPETERAPSRKPTSVADAKPAGDTAKAADARSRSEERRVGK